VIANIRRIAKSGDIVRVTDERRQVSKMRQLPAYSILHYLPCIAMLARY